MYTILEYLKRREKQNYNTKIRYDNGSSKYHGYRGVEIITGEDEFLLAAGTYSFEAGYYCMESFVDVGISYWQVPTIDEMKIVYDRLDEINDLIHIKTGKMGNLIDKNYKYWCVNSDNKELYMFDFKTGTAKPSGKAGVYAAKMVTKHA